MPAMRADGVLLQVIGHHPKRANRPVHLPWLPAVGGTGLSRRQQCCRGPLRQHKVELNFWLVVSGGLRWLMCEGAGGWLPLLLLGSSLPALLLLLLLWRRVLRRSLLLLQVKGSLLQLQQLVMLLQPFAWRHLLGWDLRLPGGEPGPHQRQNRAQLLRPAALFKPGRRLRRMGHLLLNARRRLQPLAGVLLKPRRRRSPLLLLLLLHGVVLWYTISPRHVRARRALLLLRSTLEGVLCATRLWQAALRCRTRRRLLVPRAGAAAPALVLHL